jgi:methylglutaconyl-CoA hydratase
MSQAGWDRIAANGTLRIIEHGPIREISLHRPEAHNALNEDLIKGLTEEFAAIRLPQAGGGEPERPLRGILLSASGESFCAGADLHYMRRLADQTEEENREDARRLSTMFRSVRECPVYVLARVQGAALGGGSGLVACCDRVIAGEVARFGFTEARLGLVPAVISPFVLDRIGSARGRALFPTGETFDAAEAWRIGLVDRVVAPDQLDAAVGAVLQTLLQVAPGAARAAKALVQRLGEGPANQAKDRIAEETARIIARMRALPEAREGMAAFLEKRKPSWSEEYTRREGTP